MSDASMPTASVTTKSSEVADDSNERARIDTRKPLGDTGFPANLNRNQPPMKKAKLGSSLSAIDMQMVDDLKANYRTRDDIIITSPSEDEVPVSTRSKKENSRLVSICGILVAQMSNKVLFKFCSTAIAGINGYKGKSKKGVCDLIVGYRVNMALYNPGTGNEPLATTKEHSGGYFRLVNTLMVPRVKNLYQAMDKQPTKDTLTKGEKTNQKLWETALAIYNAEDEDNDEDNEDNVGFLKFLHEDFVGANPSEFCKLTNWQQLKDKYMRLRKQYNSVYVNSKRSGGGGEFSNYSLSNTKVLYFHHFLKENPSIHECVHADLADDVKRETAGGNTKASTPKKRGGKKDGAKEKATTDAANALATMAENSDGRIALQRYR
jgi:hypothetical protein